MISQYGLASTVFRTSPATCAADIRSETADHAILISKFLFSHLHDYPHNLHKETLEEKLWLQQMFDRLSSTWQHTLYRDRRDTWLPACNPTMAADADPTESCRRIGIASSSEPGLQSSH